MSVSFAVTVVSQKRRFVNAAVYSQAARFRTNGSLFRAPRLRVLELTEGSKNPDFGLADVFVLDRRVLVVVEMAR